MSRTVRAHTNIALIKYWGKEDDNLRIPSNPSLSMTLKEFYTDTSVTYDASLEEDIFYLDDILVEGKEKNRVVAFMDFIRSRYQLKEYAVIRSYNHVPKAAGLASSASAFAALAKAATLDLGLDDKELSRLARQGSGSASRSIYPGFVKWQKGSSDIDSYAIPIEKKWDDVIMIACLINKETKNFSSTLAMEKTAKESVYFDAWVKQSFKDIDLMEEYIKQRDIKKVGQLAQENALRMHASLLAVNMWYFEPETIMILNRVRELQKEIPVYFTMDAGPNVKLITSKAYKDVVLEAFSDVETVVSEQGPGAYVL